MNLSVNPEIWFSDFSFLIRHLFASVKQKGLASSSCLKATSVVLELHLYCYLGTQDFMKKLCATEHQSKEVKRN